MDEAITMTTRKGLAILLAALLLQACGGNDGGDNQPNPLPPTPQPTPTSGKLLISNLAAGTQVPLININYVSDTSTLNYAQQAGNTNTPTAQQRQVGVTSVTGEFKFDTADSITFTLLNKSFGPIPTKALITEVDLATIYCANLPAVNCIHNTTLNLRRLLLSTDNDANLSNGIQLLPDFAQTPLMPLESTPESFEMALAKKLSPLGRQVAAAFSPSLGINLEAPQPEADEVGGQPVPFADLFRISRPFPEYSCSGISYDTNGWPTRIPSSCDTENHSVLKVPTWASTFILRYVPYGAIPTGKYTVIYEGSGTLQYSGIANKVSAESTAGRDIIEITPDLIRDKASSGLRLMLKSTDVNNPVKNIRIAMPGGICDGNPFLRVESATECPAGAYRSFADTLAQNRNAIVFNPDYLRFLKDFKVIRTMNFTESSPRNPCYVYKDAEYTACLMQEFSWEKRAKMDQASWGGSSRTPLVDRYGRGAPLEVVIELANQLNRDPWFNIPHNATDDYVRQHATYVKENLKPHLKAYIEYTNEPWNGIFWGALYVREKGKLTGETNPYRAGYTYYATRSVEIFDRWKEIFGGADRLVRILNTYTLDDQASKNMLANNANYKSVDALASAPYFYGCWNNVDNKGNTISDCADTTKVPKLMINITSVDDIFSIIDNVNDRYGIANTIAWINKQVAVTKNNQFVNDKGKPIVFFTYEGGQHLTIDYTSYPMPAELPAGATQEQIKAREAEVAKINAEITRMQNLIRAANRDTRMGDRYTQLLHGFKDAGGQLFMLYTMPQTYHRFGSFGIKEHLNQERALAPKYDKAMYFQEEQGKCWWADCNN